MACALLTQISFVGLNQHTHQSLNLSFSNYKCSGRQKG